MKKLLRPYNFEISGNKRAIDIPDEYNGHYLYRQALLNSNYLFYVMAWRQIENFPYLFFREILDEPEW